MLLKMKKKLKKNPLKKTQPIQLLLTLMKQLMRILR